VPIISFSGAKKAVFLNMAYRYFIPGCIRDIRQEEWRREISKKRRTFS
jgi:hypothetical protein